MTLKAYDDFLNRTGLRFLFDGDGGDGGDGGAGDGKGGSDGGSGDGGDGPAAFDGATYRDHLPEELKGNETIGKYATLEELARGAIHSQQLLGKDPSSIMVKPDASDVEGRKGIMHELGLPKEFSDDAFAFEMPDHMKNGDMSFFNGFRQACFDNNVLPESAQGIFNWFSGVMKSTSESEATNDQEILDADTQALEKLWGPADAAPHRQRLASAEHAIDKLGGEELRNEINESGMGTAPHLLNALAQIGSFFAEDGVDFEDIKPGETRGNENFNNAPTPTDLNSKAMELQRQAMPLTFTNPAEARRLNAEALKLREQASRR